ncbi:MAG TPA: FMN-binding negative transcriptional regulator [Thermoanaerobaculia bacterium]|nr:FMN-binding negative transcriptional regulator [Thermoanaerobaculia bacterium]
MYIRANQHARSDADAVEVIERNMFATLVTGMIASHLPFLFEDGVLYAHMARANPHAAVVGTGESLVIFTGPHAYISPSWYAERGSVPTWAYVAVHCYGTAVLHDRDRTEWNIARLVETMESGRPNRWSMADLEPAEKDELIANVVSFEIPVTRMEAKFKVNQRDQPERTDALLAALERSGNAELAGYVRRYNS